MAEYHTVYKGPEGESTQWDDIQAKLGNRPAKVRATKQLPACGLRLLWAMRQARALEGQQHCSLCSVGIPLLRLAAGQRSACTAPWSVLHLQFASIPGRSRCGSRMHASQNLS